MKRTDTMNATDYAPYFIKLEDVDKAPAGTIAFKGPSWVLVTFSAEQRAAWTLPIVEFYGQDKVMFNEHASDG